MKLALIGDIHGNDRALAAVLEAASAAHVDRLLVTGDLVGYYFAPGQVLDLLGEWDRDVVRGNHEEMLAAARSNAAYLAKVGARYGSGVRIALEQLDAKQLDGLCSLPHPLELELDGVRILLCHGAPWDLDQYIYPDAEHSLIARCASANYDLVVTGHTHYPMQKEIGRGILVNPGSVGQTRDRQPGACWALFDTVSRVIELRRESYDSTGLMNECRQRHPELPYLSEVLERR
ncbi:MAG: metallophosphoesterase family protein [Pseudomonadota bacterium]